MSWLSSTDFGELNIDIFKDFEPTKRCSRVRICNAGDEMLCSLTLIDGKLDEAINEAAELVNKDNDEASSDDNEIDIDFEAIELLCAGGIESIHILNKIIKNGELFRINGNDGLCIIEAMNVTEDKVGLGLGKELFKVVDFISGKRTMVLRASPLKQIKSEEQNKEQNNIKADDRQARFARHKAKVMNSYQDIGFKSIEGSWNTDKSIMMRKAGI